MSDQPACALRTAGKWTGTRGAIGRLADHLSLCKPQLSSFVALSALAGWRAAGAAWSVEGLWLWAVTFLLAACGATINNLADRRADRMLARTCNRPLAAGRLSGRAAAVQALALAACAAGLWLVSPLSGLLFLVGLCALGLYTLAYTPLKYRRPPLALAAGVGCGMLPPLMGAMAAGSSAAWTGPALLALLLGLWQVPHTFYLSLSHQADFAAAGLPPAYAPLADAAAARWARLLQTALLPPCLALAAVGLFQGRMPAALILSAGAVFLLASSAHRTASYKTHFFRTTLFLSTVLVGLAI